MKLLTTIYLSDKGLVVTQVKWGKVIKLRWLPVENDVISNGVIIDAVTVSKVLREGMKELKSFSEIRLIIDTNFVTVKVKKVPKLSKKKKLAVVQNEFMATSSTASDRLVYDYVDIVTKKKSKKQTLTLMCKVESDIIEHYVDFFIGMGIEILNIDFSMNILVQSLFKKIPGCGEKNLVYCCVVNNLVNLIYVSSDEVVYCERIKLSSKFWNENEHFEEVLKVIKVMLHNKKTGDEGVDTLYIGDTNVTSELLDKMIMEYTVNINKLGVRRVEVFSERLAKVKELSSLYCWRFIINISDLKRNKRANINLCREVQKTRLDRYIESGKLTKLIIGSLVVGLLVSFIGHYLLLRWDVEQTQIEIEELRAVLVEGEKNGIIEKHISMQQDVNELSRLLDEMREIRKSRVSRSVLESRVMREVMDLFNGYVFRNITYDRELGTIRMSLWGLEQLDIPKSIMRLDDSGIFIEVSYIGHSLIEEMHPVGLYRLWGIQSEVPIKVYGFDVIVIVKETGMDLVSN